MKEIMALAFESTKHALNVYERKHCFEIFGFDFLLDVNCMPWLIEANTNPCLEESSPLLEMLIPRMLGNDFFCVKFF
jgi:D-alanine-D-alanine ligase-like ATP-grasp enzyme